MNDRTVPDTAADAFTELATLITQLGNRAAPQGVREAAELSGRASFLLGALEMSLELGGTWKGRIPEKQAQRTAAHHQLQTLMDGLK